MLKKLSLLCTALTALAGCAAAVSNSGRTITIKRDTYGVPHVYADDVRGLFYGYGHVVAEDRLYQMEMARRAVLGTVSEVMGPAYLALDKGSRASFSPDSIRAQMARLPADDAAIFAGYDDQMALFKDFGCKSEWLTLAQLDQHLESSKQLNY